MIRLEELKPDTIIKAKDILPDEQVTVVAVTWEGNDAVELFYKDTNGKPQTVLLLREHEASLEIVTEGLPWSFDGDGEMFRLVSEAYRIQLAHLFDPYLAVYTSRVDPLPHQIEAVYEKMLPLHPLRYLLADDPGAGKTIMTGMYLKELIVRGDLERCMIVCPGGLVEQWQFEMCDRFHLSFEILDNFNMATAENPFMKKNFVICRLDQLSRKLSHSEESKTTIQRQLEEAKWDLIVCDEAHKMSATFSGNKLQTTKRYRLGKLLSEQTRHFLLLTATPHNGKEEDFQLFLALLDSDRFEGHFRDGVHRVDTSDLMRRMVKEDLLKFDGKPLFPKRYAYTINYVLSDMEKHLYDSVTTYVREEMNRADRLDKQRVNRVGFALTILQRRLASSPEAIYRSIQNRRNRLEARLQEGQEKSKPESEKDLPISFSDGEEVNNFFDEATAEEVEITEEQIVSNTTAAGSITELEMEIKTLHHLENLARRVCDSGTDRKWEELSNLLQGESEATAAKELFDPQGHRRKLIIFTEHRDTLKYLANRIRTMLRSSEVVVTISGDTRIEDRRKIQESFLQDPKVQILVATDAAGEGINLQRAHLMVNYDLPWNPNRIEQRFGRIHRIGQIEMCHLWNLVASETREGEVFQRLLDKIEQQTESLGGAVFDVLGKCFPATSLRKLLIEAIREGEKPEVKARHEKEIEGKLDMDHLQELIDDNLLSPGIIDTTRLGHIREEMERAEARRLQPHFVASFFREAYSRLHGVLREDEPGRYRINHVISNIRARNSLIPKRYDRITFEKGKIDIPKNKPQAEFVFPGHPLLDSILDAILEGNRNLLRQGAVLVDPNEQNKGVRVLFYLEHAIQDGLRKISQEIQFVEIDSDKNISKPGYAPYLDYRPIKEEELPRVHPLLRADWLNKSLESEIKKYAIKHLIPDHLNKVKARKENLVKRTMAAVKERLQKEINYCNNLADKYKLLKEAGKTEYAGLEEQMKQRLDEFQARLKKRTDELEQELRISPMPPQVIGGAFIVPQCFLNTSDQKNTVQVETSQTDRALIDRIAVDAVMEVERSLGHEPKEMPHHNPGFDIESKDQETNQLRFIEVKGKSSAATTVTISKTQVLTALNKPDSFILAIVIVKNETAKEIHYIKEPFEKDLDFGVTSVNYNLKELLDRSEEPK